MFTHLFHLDDHNLEYYCVKCQNQTVLTIREHTGLPILQNLVKFLSKLLVARVTEQVILPAFGVEMLRKIHTTIKK